MPESETQRKPDTGKVGPQLKARRQALRISLAQVELDTKIRGKFLTALESGDYSSLPNDVYSRGFVAHYANHLGMDGNVIAAEYAQERGGVSAGATRRPRLARPKRIVFTGKILAILVGIVLIVGVVTYLLWELTALAGAPSLSVTSPSANAVVTGSVLVVSGYTTPGSNVSINNSPIVTDAVGSFSEKISLQNGVNAIHVTSLSKLGKSTTITRDVLAKVAMVVSLQAAVPNQTFNGIAVAISVSQTTSLLVMVDGQQQFQGTFLAGSSKVFTGQQNITVTTGNAGVTSAVVTNSVVADKHLATLGAMGQIVRNDSFTNTTNVP